MTSMPELDNPQLKLAHDFVQYTGTNIFLTGKAGTGKTTFLKRIRELSPKRMIVTAPTGVAAINAGGVTLHSFFQLAFGPHVPETGKMDNSSQPKAINKFSREKINIIRSLDLLVIDEISMVRADLLDAVDEVLRRYKNKYKPFGGVQLLMIGDLQQLAPVVKEDEWNLLKPFYNTPFFFSSLALGKTKFISLELKHIYRQSDQLFINLLNKIRENKLDSDAINTLNSRYIPGFDPEKNKGYITLTTHNNQAGHTNQLQLEKIKDKKQTFKAEISGNFPEYSYPTEQDLVLKTGAQVMFVKNDSSREKRFFNGKIGIIKRIEEGIVYVECPGDTAEIDIGPAEWNNYSFTLDEKTNEIVENIIGTFKQIPLKLAWAITIHKSQGLTFDRAIIDANAAFAHGQVYVALSRCRSLEGIVLSSMINTKSIRIDGSVLGFTREIENNEPDEKQLSDSRQAFERSLISELNDFSGIQRRMDYHTKLVRENEKIMEGKPLEICKEACDIFFMDIVDVSRKFYFQLDQLFLQNPDTTNNIKLNERISKACTYYYEKTEALFERFFERNTIETDNKAIRKSLKDSLERLTEEVEQKLACLEAGKSGFSIKSYMEARAKASIEKKPEHQPKTTISVSDEISNPDLFILLKQWRNEKARELNQPVYLVLPQKTIVELSALLPQTHSELKAIKGFGDKKVQKFGVELLEIISDFCAEKEMKSTQLRF